MSSAERTRWICERARAAGFDLCGVAPVAAEGELLQELGHLPEWLARGLAGEMQYLHDPRRADPRLVLKGARSLIVVALNYHSAQPASIEFPARANDESSSGPRGRISRYAWGDDYHDVIRHRLAALLKEMRAQFPEPFEARAYADTGPIIERVAAKYAGLGWLAKNTCLIHPQLGSWLFLGVIVTTLGLRQRLRPGIRLRPTSAEAALAAWTPAPRRPSRNPTSSTRGVASHISPSSCAAQFRKSFASRSVATSLAATSARTSAPGIARLL